MDIECSLVNIDKFNSKMYKFVHASLECICIPSRKFKEYFNGEIAVFLMKTYRYTYCSKTELRIKEGINNTGVSGSIEIHIF